MTKNTIWVATIQAPLTWRLASHGAQGCSLADAHPFPMIMLALSIGFKEGTFPEEVKMVTEFAVF